MGKEELFPGIRAAEQLKNETWNQQERVSLVSNIEVNKALYMATKPSRAQLLKEYKSVEDRRNNNLNQRARKERS